MSPKPVYTVRRTPVPPDCDGDPGSATWLHADTADVPHFRPEGATDHTPATTVRLLYDSTTLYALFVVNERYVRCVNEGWMVPTYQDSCVELFLQPRAGSGYVNFEINCGGAFWCSYVEDWTRTKTGFEKSTPFGVELCRQCRIHHSLPKRVDPELVEPVEWRIELHVPLSVLETFSGKLGDLAGQAWAGNMYKCAEENSHPHWAAWAPVSAVNFHVPHEFGTIRFA